MRGTTKDELSFKERGAKFEEYFGAKQLTLSCIWIEGVGYGFICDEEWCHESNKMVCLMLILSRHQVFLEMCVSFGEGFEAYGWYKVN